MNSKPSIVVGEAPESDDESDIPGAVSTFEGAVTMADEPITVNKKPDASKNSQNLINFASITSMFQLKDDSPALRKLDQKNRSLYNKMTSFKVQIYNNANHDLNSVNQQLLKSQVELQESLTHLKSAKLNLSRLHSVLNDMITDQHIPCINIEVPPPII